MDLAGKGAKQFFHKGNGVYCPGCFQNFVAPRCAGCGDPCMGGSGVTAKDDKTIEALNVTWHAKCFRCVSCGRAITGTFQERMGRPVCNGCARR